MPRLIRVLRFAAAGLVVELRADDPDPVRELLGDWRALRRAQQRPDVRIDALLRPRLKRLVQDGRSTYTARSAQDVVDALELAVYTELTRATDATPLHAAAVAGAHGAALLVGPSGAGKSSLARALLQRGHGYLGDEHSFLWDEEGVSGFPRALRTDDGVCTLPSLDQVVDGPLPVRDIVVLEPRRGAADGLPLTSQAEVVAHLLTQVQRSPTPGDRARLVALAGSARGWRLAREGITSATAWVERLLLDAAEAEGGGTR